MEFVDPWWLPERSDIAAGMVASTVFNTRLGRGKRSGWEPVDKFAIDWEELGKHYYDLPRRKKKRKRSSAEELENDFKKLTIDLGGVVN